MPTRAPSAESFPRYPAAWYHFAPARRLRNGPVSLHMLGRPMVAFQTNSGRVVVMDARCSHLAADLGRGCVVGESIQCPYHGWRYDVQGRCIEMPGVEHIPSFARQRCYPVEVRHEHLFFFNGPTPLFPLPFFLNGRPDDFVAGRVTRREEGTDQFSGAKRQVKDVAIALPLH